MAMSSKVPFVKATWPRPPHHTESGAFSPQKAAGHAHQPEITVFCQRGISVYPIIFDENRFGGVVGYPKWEMADSNP